MLALMAVLLLLVLPAPRTAQVAPIPPDVRAAMERINRALGVECTHCHEAGNWTSAGKPAHAMVEKMLPIFDEIPKHFDKARMPQTQCYMCHQGKVKPERQPQ